MTKSSFFSSTLVAVQMFCLAYLLLSGPVLIMHPVLLGLQFTAIFLGSWAVAVMGLGRFNIRPDPKPGAGLVTNGPYHWIRHPMYASLLLFFGVAVGAHFSWARLLVLGVLLGDLLVKLRYEESLLLDYFPGYDVYRDQTVRIIPFFY